MKAHATRGWEVVRLSWRLALVLLLAATPVAAAPASEMAGRLIVQVALSKQQPLPLMTQVTVSSLDGYRRTQTMVATQVSFNDVPEEGPLTVVIDSPGRKPITVTTERRDLISVTLPPLAAEREPLPDRRAAIVSVDQLQVEDEAIRAMEQGLNALHSGQVPDALAHLDRALFISPRFFEAHFNRSLALLQVNRLTEAETSIREAMELQPERGEVHRQLGWIQLQARRYAEAIETLRRSLMLSPADAHSMMLLGFAYSRLGQEMLASKYYRDAIGQRSDLSRAYLLLGQSQMALNRPEEARRHFQAYLDKWPEGEFAAEAKKMIARLPQSRER